MGTNYSRGLFKQLQETIQQVEKLTAEIREIKSAHQMETASLKTKIESLSKENTALKAENQKLKAIINKDSSNSSKPPSSDGLKKICNSREKTGKKVGGQPGHRGCVPILFKNPATIINHKRKRCGCGGTVLYPDEYRAKQLVELTIKATVTEHRCYSGVCSNCKATIKNGIPLNDKLTYGETVKAFVAMLGSEGLVSINRIRMILYEITNGAIALSEGTIAKWNKELSGKLTSFINEIKEKLLVQPVLRKDETGIRVNNSLHWLHVLSNEDYTLYFSNKKRGNEADKEIDILPAYSGVLVHDHLKGLYFFKCEHAECNAHILRYLQSVVETNKRAWAVEMLAFLTNANNVVKEHKARNIPALEETVLSEYHDRYDEILEQGWSEYIRGEKKDYNGEDMKLLRRLKEYKREHLRFLSDFQVPFDNNLAERDLRMIKSKTKVSGCFRGIDGGTVFANIKSYTSTLKKNSRNIFDGLKAAFLNAPFSWA
ncbi:MAG: IS66 family transposase [Treponema sp.]|nr:IS66 family transposase [Treponema sp.]